jgi:hypothetical protein
MPLQLSGHEAADLSLTGNWGVQGTKRDRTLRACAQSNKPKIQKTLEVSSGQQLNLRAPPRILKCSGWKSRAVDQLAKAVSGVGVCGSVFASETNFNTSFHIYTPHSRPIPHNVPALSLSRSIKSKSRDKGLCYISRVQPGAEAHDQPTQTTQFYVPPILAAFFTLQVLVPTPHFSSSLELTKSRKILDYTFNTNPL